MKRIYHHYSKWEDYKNGMYETSTPDNEDELILLGISLLTDSDAFYNVCIKILEKRNNSTDVNLGKVNYKRKEWFGQAACSYAHGVTELTTRKCWAELTDNERDEANRVAKIIIDKYEKQNTKIHSGLDQKVLF